MESIFKSKKNTQAKQSNLLKSVAKVDTPQ